MFTKTLLATAFAALAVAAPATLKRAATTTYSISINVKTTGLGQTAAYKTVVVPINVLTSLNIEATEIIFVAGSAVGVDIDSIECRAYKDAAGVVPGSAPFTDATPAQLSTNLVEVGSVLCYVTESS